MKKRFFKILSVFLLLTVLTGFAFSIASSGANIDYSRPGSGIVTTIFAGEILKELGYNVSEEEEKYLEKYCDFSITHGTSISTSYVETEYESSVLKVNASPQKYSLSDGTVIEWIPVKAVLNQRESSLVFDSIDGKYKTQFENVIENPNGENTVKVLYEYEIVISKEVINFFLNKAYADAPDLKAEKDDYLENKAAYEAYLSDLEKYKEDVELYNLYVIQLNRYNEQNEKYQNYLEEIEQYDKDLANYREYESLYQEYSANLSSYLTYIANPEAYHNKLQKYEDYLKKLEFINRQLTVIEQTKHPVTHLNRTTYSDIMGDTVTAVIENRDLIANELFNVSPDVVNTAGAATKKIRELLTSYFNLTGENEKYSYYSLHYEEFRDSFTNLFRSLDKLYRVKQIREYIEAEGKTEKYVILLSQLYRITNALTDGKVSNYEGNAYFDSTYRIKYYIGPTKYEKHPDKIITDTDYYVDYDQAAPLEDGYPTTMKKPEALVTVKPTEPDFVKKPTKPEEVKPPTVSKPDYMAEPVEPTEITKKDYAPCEIIDGLISVMDTLCERDLAIADGKIKRQVTVKKKFIGAKEVSVTFHNEQNILIYETTVDTGTPADFVGELPVKAEDEGATYEFLGWANSDGVLVDLTNIESDIQLYPHFKKNPKKFTVNWVFPDQTVSEIYEYGSMPEPPVAAPERADENSVYYTFSGFDKPISAVTKSEEYTAEFDTNYYVPFENGGGEISISEGVCYVETLHGGVFSRLDVSKLLEKIAGKYSLKINTALGEAHFSFEETMKLKEADVVYIDFGVSYGAGKFTYLLSLLSEDEIPIQEKIRADVTFACSLTDLNNLNLYYESDESERVYVNYKLDSGKIRFSANSGFRYHAAVEYRILIIPNEVVDITVNVLEGTQGTPVYISYNTPNGVRLGKTYYIDELGEKHYFDGKIFTLNGNVSVGIDYTRIEYKVEFVSDGKVISSAIYHYGEIPEIPPNPQKSSDSKYSYEFADWSSEVTSVTGDATYVAKYWSKPVLAENDDGIQISDDVMRKILLVGAYALVFLLGVIPCVIITVVHWIKGRY